MNDPIREAFEEISLPSFPLHLERGARYANGEYITPAIEDHWQTFQEGWEAAIKHLKNKTSDYSDIMATGGLDPRN